jgi:CHASE domain
MTDSIIARSAIMEHDFEALGIRITVEEFTSQDSFPQVTLPYFEVSGADIRESPFIGLAAYAPLIRSRDEKDSWEEYAADNRGWVKESFDVFQGNGSHSLNFTDFIYRRDSYGYEWHSSQEGPWLPLWQVSPPVGIMEHINFDLMSVESFAALFDTMRALNEPVLSSIIDTKTLRLESEDDGPKGVLMHPVYSSIDKEVSKLAGVLFGVIRWDQYFVDIHHHEDKTVMASIGGSQGTPYLYELRGSSAARVLESEERYTGYQSAVIPLFMSTGAAVNETNGPSITVYATESYVSANYSWVPAVIASAVAAGFVLIIATFILYDRYIQRKNEELRGDADRSKALVSSLFPANVHDRLFNNTAGIEAKPAPKKKKKMHGQEATQVFLEERKADENDTSSPSTAQDDSVEVDDDEFFFKSKPIADHFPHTTIMFADIAGFTGKSRFWIVPGQLACVTLCCSRTYDPCLRSVECFSRTS